MTHLPIYPAFQASPFRSAGEHRLPPRLLSPTVPHHPLIHEQGRRTLKRATRQSPSSTQLRRATLWQRRSDSLCRERPQHNRHETTVEPLPACLDPDGANNGGETGVAGGGERVGHDPTLPKARGRGSACANGRAKAKGESEEEYRPVFHVIRCRLAR